MRSSSRTTCSQLLWLENFHLSPGGGSAFCADSYFGIHSTPVLPQYSSIDARDPGHSAQSAGGRRLQLNTHAPHVCNHGGFGYGGMVYADLAPTRQQFHMAPVT